LEELLSYCMRCFEVTAGGGNGGSDLISVPHQHPIRVLV
jgi:hypothetical protein